MAATPLSTLTDAAELQTTIASASVMCLRFDARLEKQEFEQIAELFGPINNPIARTKAGDWYQYSNRRQAIDAGYVFTDEDREKSGEATFDLLDATTREEIAG